MGIFRFSNSVSDIAKFIRTYKVIYNEFRDTTDFTHDDTTKTLIEKGLVSSSGAIGEEALSRSYSEDRSRDPLYNQMKMYSEIYRMLGWFHPGSQRTNFIIPPYGAYINDATDQLLSNHFELNTLHIVGPNPFINIKGGNLLRPFPLILKILDRLGGVIHRDEIILTVLNCQNDRVDDVVDNAVSYIKSLRGDKKRLDRAYQGLMDKYEIGSPDTLRNYTRFVLASLKFMNHAHPKRLKGIYGDISLQFYKQADRGKELATQLELTVDIREEDLIMYNVDERAHFARYMFCKHLVNLGYDFSSEEELKVIRESKEGSKRIIEYFDLKEDTDVLYFPYQETEPEVLEYIDNHLND